MVTIPQYVWGNKMAFKVSVDQEKCIGCAACTATCDNFEMNDAKAQPVKWQVEEIGCNNEAKDVCPVEAIKVQEI